MHFQHNNAEDLSRRYETVLRLEVEERDQGTCERIISDAESFLNDEERLFSSSVSHRRETIVLAYFVSTFNNSI